MVGLNRHYAPHVQTIKALLRNKILPKNLMMTVNADALPSDHRTQNTNVGGRRTIGERCHFIDLLRYLAGSPIQSVSAVAMD